MGKEKLHKASFLSLFTNVIAQIRSDPHISASAFVILSDPYNKWLAYSHFAEGPPEVALQIGVGGGGGLVVP